MLAKFGLPIVALTALLLSMLAGCSNQSTPGSVEDRLSSHQKCDFVTEDGHRVNCNQTAPQWHLSPEPSGLWYCTDRTQFGPWKIGGQTGFVSVWYNPQTGQNGVLYDYKDAAPFPVFVGVSEQGSSGNQSFSISNSPVRGFIVPSRSFEAGKVSIKVVASGSTFNATGALHGAVHEVYWLPPTPKDDILAAINAFTVHDTTYWFFAQRQSPLGEYLSTVGGTWSGQDYSLNITMGTMSSLTWSMAETRLLAYPGTPLSNACLA